MQNVRIYKKAPFKVYGTLLVAPQGKTTENSSTILQIDNNQQGILYQYFFHRAGYAFTYI